ncbi:ribonuclease [Butyrivibrio sp. X503]|nr:ribonuclease [Butyrivibrio sp. X503]
MQDLGSAGKEPAGNSTGSSFTGGYSASSAGGGSKVGSPSSKTDTQSTIGSGLGKYSSKKDDSKPNEDFFEDDFPDENDGGEPEAKIPEGGTYTSKQEVALYLHTYHRLPSNYITKKQANQLGWNGGSLEKFAPGKCIGGDFFGNYEGRLPEDHEYHECDIDTLKADNRGEKRLVYSDDFHIYYTDDHYTTFELLYEP